MDQAKPAKRHRTPAESLQMARSHIGRTGLVVAVVALVALAFAPFGVHEAMFDLDYAVGVIALKWSWGLAVLAVILGVAALLMAMAIPPRRGFITPLVTLVLAAGALAVLGQLKARVAANPPIYDVATDWSDPLVFGSGLLAARGAEANRVLPDPHVGINHVAPRLEGMRVAEMNARACPGAAPLILIGSVDQAYAKARQALLAQGYELVTENPAAGRLEATATTRLLKLQGDLLVRIRPEGAGARLDMRSVSRTGVIDMGENCRRVTRLRRALNA